MAAVDVKLILPLRSFVALHRGGRGPRASGIVDGGKHGPGHTWSRLVSMVPAKLRGVVKGEHEHELGRGLDGNGGR